MAYDANLDATFNPSVGGTPTAAYLDAVNANFAALGGAWTAFTPTWTGTGSNPTIGTGSIQGAYVQLGKMLHVRYRIAMGGTTTYGTGGYKLRLPNGLSAVAGTTQVIDAFFYDAGTAYYRGVAIIGTDPLGDFDDLVMIGADGGNLVGPASPITFASGDVIVVQGTIEVA